MWKPTLPSHGWCVNCGKNGHPAYLCPRPLRSDLPAQTLKLILEREGYVVTRSQARLTAEKLSEWRDAPGFAETFLVDGKPPPEGATLKQAALAATLDRSAIRAAQQ